MKRYKNGAVLLENEQDKKDYYAACIYINYIIKIIIEYPFIWQDFKIEYPCKVEQLKRWIKAYKLENL